MSSRSGAAPAKLNLTLRVLGRRADGFHELESLVARLAFHDTLTVTDRPDPGFTIACNAADIPTDERNLVWQAARRLAELAGGRRGAHIELDKRIPAGAGLGGGSANAATTLRLLNELWELDLPAERLAVLGAEIGSDVPLFFSTPLCILRGRGEVVVPVKETLRADVLLILPAVHSSTADVYRAWAELADQTPRAALEVVRSRLHDVGELAALLFNDLQAPALHVSPQLRGIFAAARAACPLPLQMTGSGAALFALAAPGDPRLDAAEAALARADLPVRSVRTSIAQS